MSDDANKRAPTEAQETQAAVMTDWPDRDERYHAVLSLVQGRDDTQTENARLRELLRDIDAIRQDSEGVAGFHLNGDVADWDEFDAFVLLQAVLHEAAALDTPEETT